MSIETITPQALWQLFQVHRDLELIDVRTPAEYESVHVEEARLVPLDALDPQAVISQRRAGSPHPLYIICKSGGRSAQACQKFQKAGFNNVVSVDGGTSAWEQAGLPVIRGQWILPLDRQVQTVAGLIALTGMILGTFVQPWWYILPTIVGFGLTMAGLTGFCPMAVLLAKMPWNRSVAGAKTCCAR